jgi:hypothetical protein
MRKLMNLSSLGRGMVGTCRNVTRPTSVSATAAENNVIWQRDDRSSINQDMHFSVPACRFTVGVTTATLGVVVTPGARKCEAGHPSTGD